MLPLSYITVLVPALAYMSPPELQQLALNFLATFFSRRHLRAQFFFSDFFSLVVALNDNGHTSARAQKNFYPAYHEAPEHTWYSAAFRDTPVSDVSARQRLSAVRLSSSVCRPTIPAEYTRPTGFSVVFV